MPPVTFSPGADFYAAAAQVIPLLLLALVFEARAFSRVGGALSARLAADLVAVEQEAADRRQRREDLHRRIAETRAAGDVAVADFLQSIDDASAPLYEESTTEMGRKLTLAVAGEKRRTVLLLLIVGVASALTAEVAALAALVLSDPPDGLAVVVLAGAAVLLGALTLALVHLVVHEVKPKDTDTSRPPEGVS